MLTDSYSRKLDYLRVSITDKCNLRCSYCMPAEGVELLNHDEVLRNEEFVCIIELFASLGIRKVRFTGGEPLVRKQFIDIIAGTRKACPDLELCLTTNGILLDEALRDLKKYNVKKLNISLDTLSQQEYIKITGRDYFKRVISNIEKAISMNFFDVKINSVLREELLNELDDYLDYFKDKNVILRFIEKMPFSPDKNDTALLTLDDFTVELVKRGELIRNNSMDTRVALMYNFKYRNKFAMKIGIIPPMSHNFCANCNRLRLTCDGFLRTCLLSNKEYDLKSSYRMDMGDEVLKKIILRAVDEKPKSHNIDCTVPDNVCSSIIAKRTMSKIGG
ncbi:MAG: GTP 3',8-cyclase MoaA [Spirochaetes bacterium]|nr:GTP 3',8-cyclase MoaA [Spirochaetota bacterium]